jgi:hypothetical protein
MTTLATYTHTQNTLSSTWVITHNLNTTNINIDVIVEYNSSLEKILPNAIEVVDSNTVHVVFTNSFIGSARIAGSV